MVSQEAVLGNRLNARLISKQIGGMKLSSFFSLPEKEFNKLINKIEQNPLFKRLACSEDKTKKAIKYKRLPHTVISPNFYQLNESITPSQSNNFDLNLFLKEKKKIIPLIKRLGKDKFKTYFLYNEDLHSDKSIACKCQLTIFEIKQIKAFINDFFIQTEFYNHPAIAPENQVHYTKIASIRKESSGDLSICCFSLNLAKGRYLIDYKKIEILKKQGIFPENEIPSLNKLLNNLELINRRKTTIYRVILHIKENQAQYLRSGSLAHLNMITQKELANCLNVHPSVICRIIKYKTIEMPWGEEKPIKFFFSDMKNEVLNLIYSVIKEEKAKIHKNQLHHAYSDRQIQNKLKDKYKINLARRTVREYRNELRIPPSSVRTRNKSKTPLALRNLN